MPTIETQMTEIQEMDLPALRDAWRRHYRVPPPRRLSRDLLMRGIAYTLQECIYSPHSLRATTATLNLGRESGRPEGPGALGSPAHHHDARL